MFTIQPSQINELVWCVENEVGTLITRRNGKVAIVGNCQMSGRGSRIPEGINNILEAKAQGIVLAKEDCLIIDVVDNTTRHSLITLASLFGLNPRLNMHSKNITNVVDEFNDAQHKAPQADLNKVEDIEKLKAFVEEIDLFTVKFAPEVVENSDFMWFRLGEDKYQLNLPNSEQIVIWKDLLEQYEVQGTVKGNTFAEGKHKTLHDAFVFADQMLTMFGKDMLTLLRRSAKWHKELATEKQLIYLKRLNIVPPAGISKGDASKLLSQALARPLYKTYLNGGNSNVRRPVNSTREI